MTKSDRVERMVAHDYQLNQVADSNGEWEKATLVLLRREQRRPIRLIQHRIRAIKAEWTEQYPSCEVTALENLLAALRKSR